MVCLTNCSCRAWFSFYLFNAIICPQTMVYPKEKFVCYRILQSVKCASFKTNKIAHWYGLYPQSQSTSLYILSSVLTCKSDHFSGAFDLTKLRKRRYYQITWNGRRNAISPLVDIPIGALFFGVLHFLQIWAAKYPLKLYTCQVLWGVRHSLLLCSKWDSHKVCRWLFWPSVGAIQWINLYAADGWISSSSGWAIIQWQCLCGRQYFILTVVIYLEHQVYVDDSVSPGK